MPKRESAPLGAPCWIDLFTSDPEKSKAFYGELFGWTAEDAGEEYGHYINFSKDGVRVAGGMQNDGSGGPDAWSVYLATADAKATEDLARAEGAQVIVAPMDVGTLGTMEVLIDPSGAAIGAWQPRDFPGLGPLRDESYPDGHPDCSTNSGHGSLTRGRRGWHCLYLGEGTQRKSSPRDAPLPVMLNTSDTAARGSVSWERGQERKNPAEHPVKAEQRGRNREEAVE